MESNDCPNLGIPQEPHIPRHSLDNDLKNYSNIDKNSDLKWKSDFNQLTKKSEIKSQKQAIQCLQKSKNEIEKILIFLKNNFNKKILNQNNENLNEKSEKMIENNENLNENSEKMIENNEILNENSESANSFEEMYFDIPFPVPDTTISKEKRIKPKLNAWTKEKIELYETIDQNCAEIGKQHQLILALKQEKDELKTEIEKINEKIKDFEAEQKIAKYNEILVENFADFFNKNIIEKEIKKGKKFKGFFNDKNGFGIIQSDDFYYLGFVDKNYQKNSIGKEKINNSTYVGNFKNGEKSGFGKLTAENYKNDKAKTTYIGNFLNGKKSGQGKLIVENKFVYEGEFLLDERSGFGKAIFEDGAVYEGCWNGDYYDGHGKLLFSDLSFYVGDWKEGVEHGKGKWEEPDGMSYQGDWEDGRKHGKGIFTHTEGWIYEGDWVKNKKEGKGKMEYQKTSYDGDWKDDCRHGEGIYVYSNTDNYVGKWEDNLAHGKGIYTFKDGAVYEGNFRQGWPFGEGSFTFPSGQIVTRDWKEHLPSGYRVEIPWHKTMYR